jgi:hypothetical protein
LLRFLRSSHSSAAICEIGIAAGEKKRVQKEELADTI